LSSWLMTLAVIAGAVSVFFAMVTGGTRLLAGRRGSPLGSPWRGVSIAFSAVLLILAARVYLGRFDRLFIDHTGFAGVTDTDAHAPLPGSLAVAGALVLGSAIAALNAVAAPRLVWLAAAIVPAAVCYVLTGGVGWYVNSFIVKPNELVRERPYIGHNIE